MIEKYTSICLPGGEWLKPILTALKSAGLKYENGGERDYGYTFWPIPLLMVVVRATEVPSCIYDPDTIANIGLTGSDVTTDQGISTPDVFPLYELEPEIGCFPRPRVILGATPNLINKVSQPQLADLQGSTIYTSYSGLTKKFLTKNNVAATIKTRGGKIERQWQLDPNNLAIVDITSSGSTTKANGIQEMQTIMQPGVVFVRSPQISRQDQERIDDLREKIQLEILKRKDCYESNIT